LLNFLVYLADTIVLGGDALNHGSVRDGHFYIKSHGRTKEVTEGLFEYSRWQASTLNDYAACLSRGLSSAPSSNSMPRSDDELVTVVPAAIHLLTRDRELAHVFKHIPATTDHRKLQTPSGSVARG
jgi:hypothetical protein